MEEPRGRPARIVAVGAVFVLVFLARWATQPGLQGDDHWSLWTAATLLKGDLPFRDFVDVGDPLYWIMSALAQALTGYRVVGEVVLGTALVACAFAITFHLSWRATGSWALGAAVTAIALLPLTQRELYSYPKVFVYPLGLWLCWRYIDRPSLPRSLALALGVAVAFGYRHDHGAYVGMGATAALLAAHWREGVRPVVLAGFRCGALLALLLAPYLALVQASEGIVEYFQDRIQLAGRLDEGSRRTVSFSVDTSAPAPWFGFDPPHPARVFVDWARGVSAGMRRTLEERYSLTDGIDPKRRAYEYFLADVSNANLTALVGEPTILDSSGIAVSYRTTEDGSRVLDDVRAVEPAPPDAPPAAQARVEIRWDSDLDEAERARLEQRYGLLNDRNNWEYALTDVSVNNVRAIVQDPRVNDTGLIDRDTYRPMEESWLIRAQRAIAPLRVSVAPRYWHAENAGAALHYLALAMPYLLFLLLGMAAMRGQPAGRMMKGPEKMFAAATMMAIANLALLRSPGYFADHANMTAVLGACALGFALDAVRTHRRPALRVLTATGVAGVLAVSTLAAVTYARGGASLAETNDAWLRVWERSVRTLQTYSTSPPIDMYAPPGATGDVGLIRYVYECTRPDDRVWVLSDLFTFPYYTERRVVGHIYWANELRTDPEYQQRTIDRVDREEVPIIIGLGASGPLEYFEPYPLVHAYVAERYTNHYAIPEERGGDEVFWLLTDSRRTPTGTYEPLGLPCFA